MLLQGFLGDIIVKYKLGSLAHEFTEIDVTDIGLVILHSFMLRERNRPTYRIIYIKIILELAFSYSMY